MQCPECKEELQLPSYTTSSINSFETMILVRADCCNKLIKMSIVRHYKAEKYTGTCKKDYWNR
jgi:hypothetical protein